MARVVKMIMKTQNPDWNDIQVLLDTLMDSTEKDMVLRAAKEKAREGMRLQVYGGTVNDLVPSEDPYWDPNTVRGMHAIRNYQNLILEGVRTGIPKTLNWSKLYSVRQDKTESPSAFLERLKEIARRFTNLNVEEEAGKLQLALLFMGQSQEDIRKKLQKLEGEDTRNLDKMLEVAWKVYNNREKETSRKQQANILAVIQQGRGRGRGFGRNRGNGRGGMGLQNAGGRGMMNSNPYQSERLGPNQCAFCRQIGHWKNECPARAGILQECESEYNTPILPVRKPNVLQYADDIFLATEEEKICLNLTISLLNMLGQAGYRVSKEKAQLVKHSVIYLGCEITKGQRKLGVNRIETICAIPLPRNHQELRSFLGMIGWCRLWIPDFGLTAKPLYEALKEKQLIWDKQRETAFHKLKQALKEAPALGLPDLNKDFQLYVNERQKLALGVLTQKLGSWKRPVGYFSKQLDTVSTGWPSCLRAVAATVILIQEARKLTLGRKIEVFVPHMVIAVLEQKGGHWLSSSRMLQYQAILREQDDVELRITNHINPAEFLRSQLDEGELEHDCVEVIEQVYASRPDLKDVPMENPDWELFTDGSSFVENGTRYAGYSVVTVSTVIEAKALPTGTSAQKAELIGLVRALILSTGKKVNIWTDSKYAFGVIHIHGALWKEKGLLNSQGTTIKHRNEVLALLDAVHKPKEVAVMHMKGHQKDEGKIYDGNRLADATARGVARHVWTQMALIPTKVSPVTLFLVEKPNYSVEDEKLANLLEAKKNATGWDVVSQVQSSLCCSFAGICFGCLGMAGQYLADQPRGQIGEAAGFPSIAYKIFLLFLSSVCRIKLADNTATVKELERPLCGFLSERCSEGASVTLRLTPEAEPVSSVVKNPLGALENLMLDPRLDCFQQNMLNSKMIISDPSVDLKKNSKIIRRQIGGTQNIWSPGKIGLRNKSFSIKDKISQWEGKKEMQSAPCREEEQGVKEEHKVPCVTEKTSGEALVTQEVETKRLMNWELECKGADKENERKARTQKGTGQAAEQKGEAQKDEEVESSPRKCKEVKGGKWEVQKENLSVLSQVKKLEQALKDGSAELQPQLPGTYYSPQCSQEKAAQGHTAPEGHESICGAELNKRILGLDSETSEPIFGTLEEVRTSHVKSKDCTVENVYTEPGVPEKKPFINPLPKPRRTFKHEGEEDWVPAARNKRNLPPLPSIPPPPLPSSPPPSAVSRRLWSRKHKNNADHRKSYEFEDLLQSLSENGQVDWYAQTKLARTRTLSEEDILDPPLKENPYEDIETNSRCLGKKCVLTFPASPTSSVPGTPTKLLSKPILFRQNSERWSFKLPDIQKLSCDGTGSPSKISPPSTPSSPDDTFFSLGDPQNGKRRRKIPKLVLKINAIYEARRGKKCVKRLSQSTESNSGKVTDENSESDSDTEEKLKAHSQRLVHVKSHLKQTPWYQTLEQDLIEYQERQLFEYFVVVSLHKKQAGAAYIPEVTQQFPLKLECSFKFMREAEDQLKAIPQFCFPDAKDWAPIHQFASETFSFVLTGEDGSRRFGYCRRLLPSGKGNRLPEVYCIVSHLGCFNLFSKILDEVEKRRGISPALVQPLMRSVMEAPFPALGQTITVKNFLPGSGTEVIELRRPLDSRLEHVDFESLFTSLSVRHLSRVFASLLLERRVIFIADKLSLTGASWAPFLGNVHGKKRLSSDPDVAVLVVDLVNNWFLRQMEDEDSILPCKLQAALEHILEQRNELASDKEEGPVSDKQETSPLNEVVSEAFVHFFVEIVGHYSLFLMPTEREERTLQREVFHKSISSKSLRRFLEVFMETQMFGGFIQERELWKQGVRGLFEVQAQEYLETLPSGEQSGVNRFLKGLGSKMKFLHKK
ncbi:LOW QUALITY PROTEIN: DENN domain-containing protein 2A-like [Podargus strigoides]